jgi:hypothetical protein
LFNGRVSGPNHFRFDPRIAKSFEEKLEKAEFLRAIKDQQRGFFPCPFCCMEIVLLNSASEVAAGELIFKTGINAKPTFIIVD